MERGTKLWVRETPEGPWLEATYELRIERGEPLGKHSVYLLNGAGRRIVAHPVNSQNNERETT